MSYGFPSQGQANGIFFQSANGSQPFQAGWDGYAASDSPGQPYLGSKTTFAFGAWHHIATTFFAQNPLVVSGPGTVDIYVDGVLDNSEGPSQTSSMNQDTNNVVAEIGAWVCNYNPSFQGKCNAMTGSADEIRISKTNRSADWIKAEYLNQSNPAAFVAVGPAVAAGH